MVKKHLIDIESYIIDALKTKWKKQARAGPIHSLCCKDIKMKSILHYDVKDSMLFT